MKSFFIANRSLFILIAIGFILRIIPAFIFYGTGDVTSDSAIAVKFLQGKDLYRQTNYNHFPVLIFLWAFAEIAEDWTGIGKHFWQKVPSVASDAVITYLIYDTILKIRKSKKDAFNGALLYTFNPVVLLITSFHGQYESLVMMIVVFILRAFHFGTWKNISKKVLVLSFFGIMVKGWVVLTAAVVMSHLKYMKRSLIFLSNLLLLLAMATIPLILIHGYSFIHNTLTYFPAGDHGLGAVFEHFPSFFEHPPLSYIHDVFFWGHSIVAKLIAILLLIFALIKGAKMNVFNAMLLVYLTLYSISTGLGSQYLMWVIPLAIIVKDRFLAPYSFIASLAIIVFYLDRYQSAFTATVFPNLFGIGSLPISYGKMIFILWIFCIIWTVKKFKETS